MNWEKKREVRDALVLRILKEIIDAELPCCYAEQIPERLKAEIENIAESVAERSLFTDGKDAD